MRKLILVGIVVFLAMVFIRSQHSIPATQAQSEETVTLVIWGEPGTVGCIDDPASTWEFCNYVRELNEGWSAAHPNIQLQWESHGWDAALNDALQEAIAAGNPPDITVGESFMPQLVNAGLLLPLQLSEEQKANLIPATVQGASDGENIYGVAAFTAVFTLEINADVFLFAGIDPNSVDLSTWEGVSETAALITEAGNGDFYGFSILGPTRDLTAPLFRFMPYLYQAGSDLCNAPACDTPTFNDPKAVPVYEWFRELYQYTPPDLTFNGDEGYVFSQLFAGYTAMQTAGSWHPSWASGSGCEDCRYLPLPLPPDGNAANVVVGNAMYSVLASSEHPEEATLFLEWLMSDEVQQKVFWTGVGGRLPTTFTGINAIKAAMEGDTSSVPEFYTEALGKSLDDASREAQVYAVFIEELLGGDVRILPPWAQNSKELNQLWNEMFQEVLVSDRPVVEILDEYQTLAEAIVQN
jgi:ABC-type glycerol-3-phosphate transport system substrate-binding protein